MTEVANASVPIPGLIVAKAGTYYRNMRYLMCVVLVATGLYFLYDGLIGYPKENELIRDLNEQRDQALKIGNRTQSEQLLQQLSKHHEGKQHSPADLILQKGIGVLLPPLGAFILIWALYNSRGEYRLQDHVLSVPGHPPVPLDRVNDVDRRLWDRKGIAYVKYQLSDGIGGTLKLDDFVYERKGTDAIYDQLPKPMADSPTSLN